MNLERNCGECLAHNIGPDHVCPPFLKALVQRYRGRILPDKESEGV